MNEWSRRKRVVLLIMVGAIVTVVTGISIAVIDDYARGEVRSRAQAEYFPQLSHVVAEAVEKQLRDNGCSDVQAGVEAARQFLAQERNQMRLEIKVPDWGWQIERYRFTIRWRSSWIAEFRLDASGSARVVAKNQKFEDRMGDIVCPPACGGRVVCALGNIFSYLGGNGS